MQTWMEVDLSAIRQNAAGFRRILGEAELIAVVKADGYGHGGVAVTRALTPVAHRFAVATPGEALELREAGVHAPIMLLYPILPETAEQALETRAEVSLSCLDDARILHERATRRQMSVPVHVKVNTGMNRYGVEPPEVKGLLDFCAAGSGEETSPLRMVGLWTHFASADDPADPQTFEQYSRFMQVLKELHLESMFAHAANSAAMLNFPQMALDGARIGISLYGAYPSQETRRSIPLKPALTWKARIARVENLKAGESVSYNRLFTASKEMRIATLEVGYADGYPRVASNRGAALVHGKRAPILGHVCMDALVCDVTHIPNVAYGEAATLIGRDGDEEITVDQVAAWGETISYEIFTRIGRRVKRIYKD